MKEIGGYLELERNGGREYYPGLMKYNLGRTACADFFTKACAKKIYLPYFLCSSVIDTLKKRGFECIFYHIDRKFMPDEAALPKAPSADEWIYVNNAYGQVAPELMAEMRDRYGNVLFDNTHAFFQKPVPGAVTYYSVRKFFGVSDGAYLYTEKEIDPPKETDISYTRYRHILGRFEETASAHYTEMLDIARMYNDEIPKRMSRLTQELLGAIDYDAAEKKRSANFMILDVLLGEYNLCEELLKTPGKGPFAYPMLVHDGVKLRRLLAAEKIYIPTYWTNVSDNCAEGTVEQDLAANILALPVDQRYDASDMERVAAAVQKLL